MSNDMYLPRTKSPSQAYPNLGERRAHHLLQPRVRAIIAAAVVAGVYLIVGTLIDLGTRQLRNSPTDFSPLNAFDVWDSQAAPVLGLIPSKPVRSFTEGANGLNIDDRYVFREFLGVGCEGSTALYQDTYLGKTVVIKRYKNVQRNQLSNSMIEIFQGQAHDWPPEIPAMLLFGNVNDAIPENPTGSDTGHLGFLPVLDYFLVNRDRNRKTSPKWHLVSPYISNGTLKNLARRIYEEQLSEDQGLRTLDASLRPVFNNLLARVSTLHDKGYCHNDIKPSNILAHSLTDWILGDLGNVRQIHHPFYATNLWKKKNQWSDCRANDIRRALKTYLWVLRAGTTNKQMFDEAFYAESEPWSRMYWNFIRRPVYAKELLSMQRNTTLELNTIHSEPEVRLRKATGDSEALSIAVTRELTCTSLQMTWRDWWTLGGFRPKRHLETNYAVDEHLSLRRKLKR